MKYVNNKLLDALYDYFLKKQYTFEYLYHIAIKHKLLNENDTAYPKN